jgi:hypothetical protein
LLSVKVIRNIESNRIGVKSLSGSCDIQVMDKSGSTFMISTGKGSELNLSFGSLFQSEALKINLIVGIIVIIITTIVILFIILYCY